MTGFRLGGGQWTPPLPTSTPSLVACVELTTELGPLPAEGFNWAYILVKAKGRPIGWITCPVTNGECAPVEIRRSIASGLSKAALSALLCSRLEKPLLPGSLRRIDLFGSQPVQVSPQPRVTVAVCTRDRPEDLNRCLDALTRLEYDNFEVIIIDNASVTAATRDLVETRYRNFRYVREERAGLDWARNTALREADGELIAYTDDDVVVDAGWLRSISAAFADGDVSAVTGLIAPHELRTDSQLHFEAIGGFGRGCIKVWYRVETAGSNPDVFHLGSGRFGAGANMSFRVKVLRTLGGFDPALDVGSVTQGGGDLDMFFRVLHEGYTLVYEPAALVWHRHRDTPQALQAQLSTWGTAIGAVLTASFLRYRGFRRRIVTFGLIWSWLGYIAPILRNSLGPGRVPRRLRLLPLRRLFQGPWLYHVARNRVRAVDSTFNLPTPTFRTPQSQAVAIRVVDLAEPLAELADILDYCACEIHVQIGGKFVGTLTIQNRGHPISVEELRARIAQELADGVLHIALADTAADDLQNLGDLAFAGLRCADAGVSKSAMPQLASIVVATLNRPESLRRCLTSLVSQTAYFLFEVIIVDNDPSSGLTAPVVAEFPGVRLVSEPIQGLAQARNTGFRAATGDIFVATDDDVVAPPCWLQELIQPFRFAHIGVVTGRTVALELEHPGQLDFEALGGLGKGAQSFEVGLDWMSRAAVQPPPAWRLGATANAAFRREMLQDPRVGLLPENLGPGTPAGGGEDAYLFYRAAAAGYGIYYEAGAMLRHEHRKSSFDLRWQMFNYSRGHVAYLLTTAFRDLDLRAIIRLCSVLPAWHLYRLFWPLNRLGYRRSVVLFELAGYAAGTFGWLHGNLRDRGLRRRGRIPWYHPVDAISASSQKTATRPEIGRLG